MQPENNTRENISMKMVAIMATVLIIAVFSLVVTFPFLNWGDATLVLNNPAAGGSGPAVLHAIFNETGFEMVTPVTLMSFAFEQGFAGLNANTFHFDNIILAILNTLMVLMLLGRLFPQRPVAVAAAVFFFAVHPLHVETVAWVSGRPYLLAGFFFLLSLLSFLEAHQRGWRWYLVSIISFTLSVLSSPAALATPLSIFLLEKFTYREADYRKIALRALPYFAIAVAFSFFQNNVLFEHGQGPVIPPVMVALKGSAQALIFYISKSLIPSHLSALYEAGAYHLTLRDYVVTPLILVTLALAAYVLENIRRPVIFAVLFFALMILPALPITSLPHRGLFADSEFYVAGIGLILAYALIFSELARFKKLQIPLMGCGALLIGSYLAVAHSQTMEWSSSQKMWSNIVKQSPGSSRAQLNLGEVLYEQGEIIGAGIHYFQAIKLNPKSAQGYSDLGLLYLSRQRFDKAVEYLKQAAVLDEQRADIHLALGMAYSKNADPDNAKAEWQTAEKLEPQLHDKILLLQGDKKSAPLVSPKPRSNVKNKDGMPI